MVLPTISNSIPFANGGQPQSLPGTIQAEDFDKGGADIAFYDVDPENWGSVRDSAKFQL